VCEIRDLRLHNARFRPGGRFLIGGEVPLPLFWEQYANHQDTERNTASAATVRVVRTSDEGLEIECSGRTRSSAVFSRYVVSIRVSLEPPAYRYDVAAEMMVAHGFTWRITPNKDHGEVEFCNFWPDGVFSADVRDTLRYDGCYRLGRQGVLKIPHHHMESSDKHNVLLRCGDRLTWLLEEENPCITILSQDEITAGVCAYMWDVHLAYKVCHDNTDVLLPGGTTFAAAFRLSSMNAEEGNNFLRVAQVARAIEADQTPAIVDGVHSFLETCGSRVGSGADIWPWETEVVDGNAADVTFAVDREVGWDDTTSVRITSGGLARALWKATAIGPAFRQALFPDGARYRMIAYVQSDLAEGSAGIALRLHREGEPGLFDAGTYELFRCGTRVRGRSKWTLLELVTPPISPAPDRVHLLLDFDGAGTCWFDNVHFTREQ
jgi:hypothetical protein